MDTILLIGGRVDAITKAQDLGLRVVLLQHKDRLQPGQAEAADALLLVDYLDWDVAWPIVRAAHQVYGFARVVSLVDQAMELVGRLNDELGLPGTTYEVARRFHDKLAMRAHLDDRGLERVASREVRTPDELRDFAASHGYPCILKPVDGTGSRGVVRLDGPQDVDEAWDAATSLRGRADLVMATFYPVDRLMVEEFIDGPEYSVESFSFDGHHVVISFTEKLTDGFVEMGHAEPARMPAEQEAALREHVVRFLEVMGLRDGVSCIEIKMSPSGPRIIEGHDRVAGDRIMDLVEAVYGIDLERYAVGWPFGRVPALAASPAPRGAAATRFLSAAPGTVLAVHGVADASACPGVLDVAVAVAVGDEVRSVADNFDRPGQVLAVGADTDEAIARCARALERVRIVTTGAGADAGTDPTAEPVLA